MKLEPLPTRVKACFIEHSTIRTTYWRHDVPLEPPFKKDLNPVPKGAATCQPGSVNSFLPALASVHRS